MQPDPQTLPSRDAGISQHRKAFSLSELLVAIAIIVILAAILLPVISSVRSRAAAVECVARQRATFSAITTYMTDHNGRIHLYSNYEENASWAKELFAKGYTEGSREMLVCPAAGPEKYDPEITDEVPDDPNASEFNSFGMSFPGFANWMRVPRWPEFIVSPSLCSRPAEQIFFGDAAKLADAGRSEPQNFYVVYNGEGCLHLRHSGKAMVTFADGHVEAIGPSEIGRFYEKVESDPNASLKFSGAPSVMDGSGNLISAR